MQTIRFATMDDKKVTCWCETNILKVFRDYMQYVLDSCNNPEFYMIWDIENDKVYDMYKVATQQYGMRKRIFDERMNNIQTGKWTNVSL